MIVVFVYATTEENKAFLHGKALANTSQGGDVTHGVALAAREPNILNK